MRLIWSEKFAKLLDLQGRVLGLSLDNAESELQSLWVLADIGLIILAYFLGSIPTGYWVAKKVKGIDIREHGSKSTGATNVFRCVGKGWGIFVLVVDVLKGYLPVGLSLNFELTSSADWSSRYHILPPLVATACIVGHSKSIFLKFQGGKSAATALGTLLALKLPIGLGTFLLWVFIVIVTKYVSLASMLVSVAACVTMVINQAPISYVIYAASGAVYVILRHRANIKRLLSGTEPKLGQS